ncbi:MAG: hypothetical protein JW909_00960 [Planctomycetes bacterium]|nr:hypothetical protein [Planctomycetota bacterium]
MNGDGILDWGRVNPEAALCREMRLCRHVVPARGKPVLVFWRSARPAVVMGRGRSMFRDVHVEAARCDGVAIICRPSGGGTVFLPGGSSSGLVTCVSVIVPAAGSDLKASPIRKFFRTALAPLLEGLGRLGVDASFAGISDIAVGGRKIAGSAQARKRSAVMVHASVLIETPWKSIERYIRQPDDAPDYRRGRSHGDFLTDLCTETGMSAEEADRELVNVVSRRFTAHGAAIVS